jgi:hypothetical protein
MLKEYDDYFNIYYKLVDERSRWLEIKQTIE